MVETTSENGSQPVRVINSVAPIRICDNGGWTDTWFAEYGAIFNIGVYPYAEAQLKVFRRDEVEDRIVIYAENYGERFTLHPGSQQWRQNFDRYGRQLP